MKKIVTLLFAIFLAVTASAQSHIFPAYDSNNTFTGANTFQGPFFLPSIGTGCLAVGAGGAITVSAGCGGAGLLSFQGRTATAAVLLSSDVQGVLTALTGCGTAGLTYSPASNTCVAATAAVFPSTNGLVFNTSTTASRTATPGTDFDNYNLGQLNNFRAALANSPNASVHVVLIGDNDLNGLAVATLSNSIDAQLESYFAGSNKNGYPGTGLIPVLGFGPGVTLNPEWTKTGTLTSSADLGPTQVGTNAFNSTAILTGTGVSVSLNAISNVNTITVYGETSTDTSAGCIVTVSGQSSFTVGNTTTGTPGVYKTSVTFPVGTYTTNIAGQATSNCRLYAVEWTNSNNKGTEISRLARATSTTAAWGSNVAAQLAYIGAMTPAPQLAVIMIGRYDNLNSASLATTTANYTNIVSQLRVINPQMAILIVDEPPMNTGGTGVTPAQIKTLEQSFGFTANTAYVSLGDSFGTFANANAIGAMAGDGININDKGSLAAAALIFSVLTEGQTSGVSVSGFATLQSNTFNGRQSIINPSTVTTTVIPNLSFLSNGAGFDEGLAWYDGVTDYPSTSVLKWRMGKAANNSFYGFNQTTGNNWISVAAANNTVTFNGSVGGVITLSASTVNAVTGNFTNLNSTGTLAANILTSTAGLTSNSSTLAPSIISVQAGGSSAAQMLELYAPASGSGGVTCLSLSGGCDGTAGLFINGMNYGNGQLSVFYGDGTANSKIAFFSQALSGGSGAVIFDSAGNIEITSGFLSYLITQTTTIATSGIGSSPVCQTTNCHLQSGTINVNIDGSSAGGNFLTITSSLARPTGLNCHVSAPQDPGSSVALNVTGTTTTILTFNLLNGSAYNTSAKTMRLQYDCGLS